MPNDLDPDQDRQSVGPDLGPNCLQTISADNKSHPFYRYQKAVDAKKDRASKSSQSFGAKGQRGGHPSQVGSFANVTI